MGAETIRAYRFLRADHAVAAIESCSLRVGRLNALNDPFEFVPRLRQNGANESADSDRLISTYQSTIGILCYSESITDPVVWSHYSAGHSGIALGFDIPNQGPTFRVLYDSPERPLFAPDERFSPQEMRTVIRILAAKAPSWSYEKEVRVLESLATCRAVGGSYFKPFRPDSLKHIVLGLRCTVDSEYVARATQQCAVSAKILRAKRHPERFEIVAD